MLRNQRLTDLVCIQKSDISLRTVDQNTYTPESCIVSSAHQAQLYGVCECHLLGTNSLNALKSIIPTTEPRTNYQLAALLALGHIVATAG